jgi:hypothetical protein
MGAGGAGDSACLSKLPAPASAAIGIKIKHRPKKYLFMMNLAVKIEGYRKSGTDHRKSGTDHGFRSGSMGSIDP